MNVEEFDIVTDDIEKVLDVFKEYGVEIIRRGKPREYTVSFGWLWWRKKYHSEWIKILVGHKDENFDLKEPLREAVNRGLSIV